MIYCRYYKRILDFIIVLLGLLILSPLFLIIIALLALVNNGKIFFIQPRPGRNGKLFNIIKFKSMTDARDKEGNLLPNDLRVTKIGNFIRKASIDEIPQLINVLKGDMSIVGPRPLMPRYLELYSKEQSRRHDVRPGITGWAQVNGRNAITWTKKFELDVWYVDNVSFWLDMKIIFLTAKKIMIRKDINSPNNNVGSIGFNGKN